MKIYGYTQEQINSDVDTPSSLSEITLFSNAQDLRVVANYLNNIADKIDKNPDSFEHEHLSDSDIQVSDTDIIIFNEAAI